MAPPLHSRIKALFAEAAELSPGERARFLDGACEGDAALRHEVERLLTAFESGGGPLDASTVGEFLLGRPAEQSLNSGEILAHRFRIERLIGRGGMGEVYEASDLVLGGSIALKTLRSEHLLNPGYVARFRREIQLARKVTHANVCRVFEVGRNLTENSEINFLTMELLNGETLAQRIARGRCSAADSFWIVRQIVMGLAALHEAKVVHRDLKPANVILIEGGGANVGGNSAGRTCAGGTNAVGTSAGGINAVGTGAGEPFRAVITDFGLAHAWASEPIAESITSAGQLLGTSHYMAPEQLMGQNVGPQADIYALSIVMYEMFCGVRPFQADSFAEVAALKLTTAPKPPHEIAPVPQEWSRLILRCMERNPADRPQSAREILTLLDALSSCSLPAPPLPLPPALAAVSTAAPAKPRYAWLPSRLSTRAALAAGLLVPLACAASMSFESVRRPVLDRACHASPGSSLWCLLPADKDIAVLPFELRAATPEDRDLAAGLAQYVRSSFARLAPDPSHLCVHLRDDRNVDGVHLVLEGSVESTGPLLVVNFIIRQAEMEPGSNERLVLRKSKVAVPRASAHLLQTQALEALARTLELQYQPALWDAWRKSATGNAETFRAYLVGLGRLREGRYQDALASFQTATDPAHDFMFARPHAALGTTYRLMGNHDRDQSAWLRARQAYQRTLTLDSENGLAEVEKQFGELEMATGDFPAAAERFERALAANPFDHELRKLLANAYEAAGRVADAGRVLTDGVKLTPGCWLAHNAKASFHSRYTEFREAESSFLQVLRLAPGNAIGYHNLAFDYLKAGRFDEAVDLAARSVQLEPSALRYSTLGRAFLYKGCAPDALVNLKKAVELSPSSPFAWANLAEALSASGVEPGSAPSTYARAVEACQRVLVERPSYAHIRAYLALNSARLGRASDARRDALLAIQQAPKLHDVALLGAETMETLGDRAASLAILKQALKDGLSLHEVRGAFGLRNVRQSPEYEKFLQSMGLDPAADPGGLATPSVSHPCPVWGVAGKGYRKE